MPFMRNLSRARKHWFLTVMQYLNSNNNRDHDHTRMHIMIAIMTTHTHAHNESASHSILILLTQKNTKTNNIKLKTKNKKIQTHQPRGLREVATVFDVSAGDIHRRVFIVECVRRQRGDCCGWHLAVSVWKKKSMYNSASNNNNK